MTSIEASPIGVREAQQIFTQVLVVHLQRHTSDIPLVVNFMEAYVYNIGTPQSSQLGNMETDIISGLYFEEVENHHQHKAVGRLVAL